MDNPTVVFQNILDRRTCKPDRYTGNVLPKEVIEKMLEAAHWAPTHGHTEPWQFNVYTGAGKDRLQRFLAEWTLEEGGNAVKVEKMAKRIAQSSHIISIGMQRGDNPKIPEIEELLAVAMAVQNMWLVATSLNVGAYWSSGAKAFTPKMRDFLGLKEGDRSLGFLFVGERAVEPLPGHRLSDYQAHVNWIED